MLQSELQAANPRDRRKTERIVLRIGFHSALMVEGNGVKTPDRLRARMTVA
jgi:hypothetical protein